MSFGFGGFGQNNNQSSGFGTGSGFGGNSSGGGFGSTSSPFGGGGGGTSGGTAFGSNTSGGFGSGGGFGSNTQNQSNSLFGNQNRTGFGTSNTSGGSLFGGTQTAGNTGFGTGGGFGSTGTTGTTGTTGSFGSNANTGGGLFGANKPGGFGTTTTGTGGGFGAGGGFGSPTTNTGFGGSGTAFQGALPTCEGTGRTPFNPFTEKDANSSTMNHYQSISLMDPYQKFSFDELRLADYQQGRRFGNGSGQAGAFGTSAFGGTGGFGGQQQASTGFGTSTFGAATSAPSGFGGQTQATSGFGSTPSNPLFGGSKPAGAMFGGAGGTSGTSQPGLFGTTTGTTGGFGGTGTGGGFGTTGGMFGNQQQQNKPGFGATGGTGFGGGGFSQPTTTAANPFGAPTGTAPAFGGQQQTGTGTFGGFGNQPQNQPQTQNKFGFGATNQQQQPPTSTFGGGGTCGGTPGTSLFGQPTQQQPQQGTGSLFGGTQTQQPGAGGGLFGTSQNQQQQKPGGLFGSTPSTGGGAFSGFGGTQSQQPGGGGLFGGQQNQQQQKPGGLFGTTGGTSGGLFGNQGATSQGAGPSLFGGSQNQQPQTGNLGGGSMFGATQTAQQQQPVPGSLQASLLEGNPYGSQSIFSGLPTPSAPSPGPLATPLSSANKQKQRTPLPAYKMTPNAANRLITPPKRQGYGFSYSTYGSPSSTTSTPSGLGSSLLGGTSSLRGSVSGSFGRSFSKSYSTSNLRKTFDPDSDSVLSPGALQTSSARGNTGSLKRLTIDRSLRNDLFTRPTSTSPAPITNGEDSAQPDKLKKKVSFDATSPGVSDGELVRVEESKSPEPTPEELGFLRSVRRSGSLNGVDGVAPTERPEMESVRRDLAVVPEDEPTPATGSTVKRLSFTPGGDPKPGEYWMKPTRADLSKMTRDQLKRVVNFTVGRQHCGQVTFNEPVDLTGLDLDNIFETIVDIGVRKITVYPEGATTPPLGKGLNVPSTLRIENSWPRGRAGKSPTPLTSGPLFDKHIDRLRRVTDTEFIAYEIETGTWVFKVPHFTTYGLDYEEDEEGESHDQSTMSAGPDTRIPKAQPDHPASFEQSATFSSIEESFVGSMAGVDDDTFDFKKRKIVPGSFLGQAMAEDQETGFDGENESFLEDGSTGSAIEQDDEVVTDDSVAESDEDEEMDMAGSFPNLHRTVERYDNQSTGSDLETTQPSKPFGTPGKPRLDLSGNWTEQLQRTISPRKQNRDALREIQANAFTDRSLFNDATRDKPATDSPKKGFSTSIDLMNSLFQQPRKQNAPSPLKASKSKSQGFEWPYRKQPKTFVGDTKQMSENDAAFHDSFKPRWGPMDSIVCAKSDLWQPMTSANRWRERLSIFSEGRDVAVMTYSKAGDSQEMLPVQTRQSSIRRTDGIPLVRMGKVDLHQFTQSPYSRAQSNEERLVWQLANILFNDDIEDDISAGVPPQWRPKFAHRIKKDRVTRLWEGIIRERHTQDLNLIRSPEERAIHLLCSHRVDEACKALVDSQNLHLATVVAQIGRDATSQADMANQVQVWHQNNVTSEMSEPVRALYELVAGNALRSEGKSGGALEDRASTFTFTDRFELDWFQAFGLRLWYGITEDEPVEAAVSKFLSDLATGQEPAFPHPSYRASTRAVLPSDTLGRESPLWVLLKAYSATTAHRARFPPVELPAALLPESVSGDRLTNRLSFQLHHVLVALVGHHDTIKINPAQADHLVWDYASELSAGGNTIEALFVLLHLSQPTDRKRAVQETLARFAAYLPEPVATDGSPDNFWHVLTENLQLPESWLWVAKALHARDTGNTAREVDYLIRGKHWNDAHHTFCRTVGPTAIIERDYATLDNLVSAFGDGAERKMRGWAAGGGVYEDFLCLVTARGKRDPTRLSRLVNALVAMGDRVKKSGMDGLEELVAFKEMSRAVAGWISHEDVQSIEPSAILGLPLTGDARILQTAEMSRRYYGVIMAGGY